MLNLGGLFYILNEQYNVRVLNTSALLEENTKIVSQPTSTITFPIKIYMQNVLPFQKEAFEIIKDKFELIDEESLKTMTDYEIVSIYGETCQNNPYSDHPHKIYPFLRELFLEQCKHEMIKGKRIFITRKHSETNHGDLRRCIINENDFVCMLNKYNFEYIQLEDFSTADKIKLFMESEIILSTSGSQLTFTLFSNTHTKIIEINNRGTSGFPNDHNKFICDTLNLNYNRYSNILEDSKGNFEINVIEFENYLKTFI